MIQLERKLDTTGSLTEYESHALNIARRQLKAARLRDSRIDPF